jgi:hypothetical protein
MAKTELSASQASQLPQKSRAASASDLAFALDFVFAFNTQAGREAAVLLLLILI